MRKQRGLTQEKIPEQLDLFTDYEALEKKRQKEEEILEKEKRMQQAVLDIKKKYGISLADFSLSKEHPLTEHDCFSIEEINWRTFVRHNGVEVLKEIEQRFANERDPSVHGEHFLLFMNIFDIIFINIILFI